MIKNILFDFDGTLADTAPGIVATLRQSFVQMNLPVPSEEAMVNTIGLPLWRAFQVLGNLSDVEAQRARDIYSKLFMEYEIPNIRLFPGIVDVLELFAQRGIRMAIVTSRDKLSLDVILKNNDIARYFETEVTFDDHLKSKPEPDMVLALLERMGIRADETLVVGDTTFDIEMGNRAGCRTCAVTWGNHTSERLRTVNPDWVVERIDQIPELLIQ